MSLFKLGIYLINEVFSFLEYKRRLQICSRSHQLSKILSIKKPSFKLYNYLINSFKKYNISSLNLQNLYDKEFECNKKELEAKEINLIFSCFLRSLQKNPVKNQIVKLSPLFNNYYEFLDIDCDEYVLKLVSLYDIKKNNFLKNKKITSLNIKFTVSSSIEKDISFLNENLNYLLSLNQYKNIEIIIVGTGVFTQNSFDYINLDNLEKLQLSYMDLSSYDINYFFTKIYNSHKKYPLISLDLSSNILDEECINLLCWVIEINFPKLQKINLYGNNFTFIGAEKILQKFHKSIEIDISLNKLGKKEIDLFNKYNKSSKKLKIISDFRFNIRKDFRDNNLEEFCEKFKDLKDIELFEENSLTVRKLLKLKENLVKEENGIKESQIKNISFCLNQMETIEKINFNGTYKAGKILEKCKNSFLEQIKDYNLAYSEISQKCVDITERMKNLERFNLFRITLTNDLMININNALKNNLKNIKELCLSHTSLTSKSIKGLIDIITNLKNLISLSISENDIGKNSIIQIVKNLKDNCHDLIILNISKTIEPHNDGLNELWDSLSNIYNLREFYCQDNNINYKDMILFKNKLPNNYFMLNKIDFSYNADIDSNVLNELLPEFKKYLNYVEAFCFWDIGNIPIKDLIKFRGIFPSRIRLRNKKKR